MSQRILVYEYCTATGLGRCPNGPAHSLYREGLAMRNAVLRSLHQVDAIETVCPADPEQESPFDEAEFSQLAGSADWCWLIAPETDGILLRLADLVVQAGCRLLGPDWRSIELCSDKLTLARHWERHGIVTPATVSADVNEQPPFPAVCKRRDGAGSEGMRLCRDAGEWEQLRTDLDLSQFVVQPFVEGRAASVGFFVGPKQTMALPPAWQRLGPETDFQYLGGEVPIGEPELRRRAVTLATRAIEAVEGLIGYVGVDLLLGSADDGSQDWAVEINPRMTTSFVGYQALSRVNLAERLWHVVNGQDCLPFDWHAGPVRFQPDGQVIFASR